jgi:hypothetical protein
MNKGQSGIGILGLLITLAIVVAIAYLTMKERQPAPPSLQADRAIRQKLEAQGIQAPAQLNLNSAADMSQHVTNQIQQAGDLHIKAVDCTAGGNAAQGCSIHAEPAPFASP